MFSGKEFSLLPGVLNFFNCNTEAYEFRVTLCWLLLFRVLYRGRSGSFQRDRKECSNNGAYVLHYNVDFTIFTISFNVSFAYSRGGG